MKQITINCFCVTIYSGGKKSHSMRLYFYFITESTIKYYIIILLCSKGEFSIWQRINFWEYVFKASYTININFYQSKNREKTHWIYSSIVFHYVYF